MPKAWYDRHSIKKAVPEEKQQLYRAIVADRKPYFMRYIYPALSKQYNEYVKRTNKNALREFGLTVDELLAMPADTMTERQAEFALYYKRSMPVGVNGCVINKICWLFESAFDGFSGRCAKNGFDYSIYKSGFEYTYAHYAEIKKMFQDYAQRVKSYTAFAVIERVDQDTVNAELELIDNEFRANCQTACPNEEELCDIVLDVCYNTEHSKRFAWKMCGEQIISNLLSKSGSCIHIPKESDEAMHEFSFGDKMFAVVDCTLGGSDGNYTERNTMG